MRRQDLKESRCGRVLSGDGMTGFCYHCELRRGHAGKHYDGDDYYRLTVGQSWAWIWGGTLAFAAVGTLVGCAIAGVFG